MTADDGGRPAERAVVRWAWRMFRREWRQQLLVLVLLTSTIAAAVAGAAAAFNTAPAPANAEFGDADHFIRFDDPNPEARAAQLAAAAEYFGPIDTIGHRAVPLPGANEPIGYRAQDPAGRYSAPMLDLRDGRYPSTEAEVAVTDGVANEVDLAIGSHIALDGMERTVVGVIENPSDLGDEFVLLAPSAVATLDSVTVLVSASDTEVQSFRAPGEASRITSSRDDVAEDVLAAVIVLAVSTVALLFVALVAAANFMVLAQRRQRQLGMISAIGATENHLRLVLLANGALVGLSAAILGAAIGLAGWVGLSRWMEQAVGFRIDPTNVPWWLVAVTMALAIIASTGASLWPAHAAAQVPTVEALSGRPPTPATVRRSAAAAAVFLTSGVSCLAAAGRMADDPLASPKNALLIVVGTLLTVIGVLLISPLLIRALARTVSGLPIALRLPLRDLGRHQARSGAALAAIGLAIGIPVAIVAIASAAEFTDQSGNLSDRQLLVRSSEVDGPFIPDQTDIPNLERGIDQILAELDNPTVVAIEVAFDPALQTGPDGTEAVSLAVADGDGSRDVSKVYVATPQLLAAYGLGADAADRADDVLTTRTDDVFLVGVSHPEEADRRDYEYVNNTGSLQPSYSSLPGTFMTSEAIDKRGWIEAPAGQWLIELGEPMSDDQRSATREIAAQTGLSIEWRDAQGSLRQLRTGATAMAMLLALGVLALTVGLIRNEATGDVRILAATGASRSTLRTLTAATAGGLALLGAMLGTAGAYIALIAGHVSGVGDPNSIPYEQLAIITIGTPLAALATGWLFAGSEPTAITRGNPLE